MYKVRRLCETNCLRKFVHFATKLGNATNSFICRRAAVTDFSFLFLLGSKLVSCNANCPFFATTTTRETGTKSQYLVPATSLAHCHLSASSSQQSSFHSRRLSLALRPVSAPNSRILRCRSKKTNPVKLNQLCLMRQPFCHQQRYSYLAFSEISFWSFSCLYFSFHSSTSFFNLSTSTSKPVFSVTAFLSSTSVSFSSWLGDTADSRASNCRRKVSERSRD